MDIDRRTETMTETTLLCRSDGHWMQGVPMTPSRRKELRALGQLERRRLCMREGCDYTYTYIVDVAEKVVVGNPKTSYGEGYLMATEFKGTGRIPRLDAYLALAERQGEL